jgi:uncharacterized protein
MMQLAITAFIMGAIGSFHCIGMCGPLALSLPLNNNSLQAKFIGALLYNAGRIITYTLLGFLFGLIGKSVALFGFQQWLSVILGSTIILLLVLPKFFPVIFSNLHTGGSFFQKVRRTAGGLFSAKKKSALFSIGLLNGLLPCGFVYLAIAAAVSSGQLAGSMLFMAFFGLGTLPVMWAIAFWGNFIGMGVRKKIRKAYPAMMLLVASLLIVRGMGLGIPYVSPAAVHSDKEAVIECCSKPAH